MKKRERSVPAFPKEGETEGKKKKRGKIIPEAPSDTRR